MLPKNSTRWTCSLLLVILVSGCSSTTGRHVQWYDGAPLGANQIALLKIQRGSDGIYLTVNKIDGKPLDKGKQHVRNTTGEIELLPGQHEFSVSYRGRNGHSVSDTPISFPAEAGKTYEMRAAPHERSFGTVLRLMTVGGAYSCYLWILDKETGKVIAGEARETPLHWYEK